MIVNDWLGDKETISLVMNIPHTCSCCCCCCCCCCLFLVCMPGRHAQIMRRCGLKQVFCYNPVPNSDSGQSKPRLWLPNPYSLSLTRRSNMHANDKGRMNGYIGNDNRDRNERRTDTRGTNYIYRDSQLPCLWHEGPSSSVPEHPKRPLPRSMRIH